MKNRLAISLARSFARGRVADLTLMALAVALAVFVAASAAGATAAFFAELRHLEADPSYLEIRVMPAALSRDRSKAVTALDASLAGSFVLPPDAAAGALAESPSVGLSYSYDVMTLRVGEAPSIATMAAQFGMAGSGQGGSQGGRQGAASTGTGTGATTPGGQPGLPQDTGSLPPNMGGLPPGFVQTQATPQELAEAAALEVPLLEAIPGARVDPAFFQAYKLVPGEGSLFTAEEASRDRAMLVLGAELAGRLYADGSALGKRIRLDGRTYDIVGVLQPTPYTSGRDWNGMAFIPTREIAIGPVGSALRFRTARLIFAAADSGSVERATAEISSYFERTLGAGMVTISSRKAELDERKRSQATLFAAAFGLAVLCVIVAILNLMNASATKAIKRRRSLGVLRAIGASASDVVAAAFWETAISAGIGLVLGSIAAIALYDATVSILVPYTSTNGGALPAMLAAGLAAAVLPLVLGVIPSWSAMQTAPADLVRPD
jgi:hypothetical protein